MTVRSCLLLKLALALQLRGGVLLLLEVLRVVRMVGVHAGVTTTTSGTAAAAGACRCRSSSTTGLELLPSLLLLQVGPRIVLCTSLKTQVTSGHANGLNLFAQGGVSAG